MLLIKHLHVYISSSSSSKIETVSADLSDDRLRRAPGVVRLLAKDSWEVYLARAPPVGENTEPRNKGHGIMLPCKKFKVTLNVQH